MALNKLLPTVTSNTQPKELGPEKKKPQEHNQPWIHFSQKIGTKCVGLGIKRK